MVDNVETLKDIMEYDEAHYFGINNEIILGGVITEMTENRSENAWVYGRGCF